MHLTPDQRHIMAMLEKTTVLRKEHVHRLLRLDAPEKQGRQVEAALRQLYYMNKIIFLPGDLLALPLLCCPEPDERLLQCVDIMLDVIDSPPISITTDKEPFHLCFLVDGSEGIAAFAILAVPIGREGQAPLFIEQVKREGYSTILLLEHIAQRAEIVCATPHHLAVLECGRHRYFKGGDTA